MKNVLVVLSATLIIACGGETKKSEVITETSRTEVKWRGALKNMMHKGDLTAKADLNEFENYEHLYALGAIENLKGEILILDGEVFNTSVNGTEMEFDNSYNKDACLFVYAIVENWNTYDIPDSVSTYEELEVFVEATAKNNGIDTEKPFPFMLDGTPKSFDWHVINWKDGDTKHSHEKHIHSGLYGTIENTEVDMFGFYSKSHHAIFTHHTTNMHIHVKTKDNSLAGHADGLILGSGMKLKLAN